MKSTPVPFSPLSPASDPAPALTRGLALLRHLNREGACSLDRLARTSGWPKASVLRLMRSLESSGAAARDPASKRWRTLVRLVAGDTREAVLRRRCGEAAAWLCQTAAQTAEIYAFAERGLEMVDRAEPEDVEVSVRARIGCVRSWHGVDAVVQLGLAFGDPRPTATRPSRARGNGRLTLTKSELEALLAAARARRIAADPYANANGVRRFAAPLMDASDRLIGVIALAVAGAEAADHANDARFTRLVAAAEKRIGPLPDGANEDSGRT